MTNSGVTKTNSPPTHSVFAVHNIKNHVSVVLGMDNDQYRLWVALFTNYAKANRVLHHIIDPKGKSTKPVTDDDKELWETIDATVLQWIYATISDDLLQTVVEDDSTAMECWNRIRDIFQDNQHSRAVTLEQEFSHLMMEDFSSASAYCQRLKSIADQLKNVGSPVSDTRLVLQMVSGLTEAYHGVGTIIRQSTPLPPFYRARSMLTLEEAGLAKQAATNAHSANYAKTADTTASPSILGRPPQSQGKNNKNKKKGGGNKGGKGKQGSSSEPATAAAAGVPTSATAPSHPWQAGGYGGYGGWPWGPSPWAFPPCPYPTTPWMRAPGMSMRPPVPRPQAYTAATPPSQTDIEAAMYTLGLTPPDPWYMDTGATSHMTSSAGNLSSYSNSSISNSIIVGNGQSIPISGTGNTTLPKPHPPLSLRHVLHAPKLVKNLVSVRKFTTDNSVTVEFDPFGFCVKDYKTGTPLMRCESKGALYPITPTNNVQPHAALPAIESSLWHDLLGHPGDVIFNSLRLNNLINCSSPNKKTICHSCSIGKHIKQPFVASSSRTTMPFDIIHSDLWTSPIISSAGHRYYLVLLDDFTNFLWTFPLAKKSQVYSTFIKFRNFVKTQFERDIKTIQCDNGKEFDNGSFTELCASNGLAFRFSCPHTSPQNGKAERKIRSINNIIRTLLLHASLPATFWHHALSMSTYLLNILPSKHLSLLTPLHILYHRNPSYSHIRVFGCLCYPLIPSTQINKLQARSLPCVFLGFPDQHRGYKCLDLRTNKIILSRHVRFDESTFPFAKTTIPASRTYDFLDGDVSPSLLPPIPWSSSAQPITPNPLSPTPTQPASPTAPPTPHSPEPPNSPPSTEPVPHTPPPIVSKAVTRGDHGIRKPKPIFDLNTTVAISPLPRNPVSALRDHN
ncbi:uncharacterized protein LOC141620890 [Silene latifolia]|uniref:uncharacterized protein LOC141620890 n=1 Tax=Silene latifolia TaxID=37657 RepID=UPI003D787D94